MQLRRAFSLPKAQDLPNEDKYAQGASYDAYALSDGASISYDSALWADIVSKEFAREPKISRGWLRSCISMFETGHEREQLPWHKQQAFDRGSFTSIIGIRVADELTIEVDAVGDSIALLCDDCQMLSSFPYGSPEEFDQSPLLLSTNAAKNPIFLGDDLAPSFSCHWNLADIQAPRIICATDALGQWLLERKQDQGIIALLHALVSDDDFANFILEERRAGRMKTDDTTLLLIS